MDETGAPTGNADGNNLTGKRGRPWVLLTAVVTVFLQGLSRSTTAAIELPGSTVGGIVVSDRFSACNHLPSQQRRLCWAHLIRHLTASAERPGASAEFGAQLLELQRLGYQRGERTPWANTVRTAQQLLQLADGLWTFLETRGSEPTTNGAARALHQSVIQRRINGLPGNSRGVQSSQGAICRSRQLTVITTPRQQGRAVWQFLEQAWLAHHRGGVMPSLLPDP